MTPPLSLQRLKKIFQTPSLALVCFLGLILAVGAVSALVFFSLYPGRNPGGGRLRVEDPFYRGLREYDALFAKTSPLEEPGLFTRTLDRLEKGSIGVETRLSLLKRRRALALLDSRFRGAYQEKALEAAAAFPHSESLAAVAVDALADGGRAPIPAEGETALLLRDLSSRIFEARLSPLVLGVRVLSGDLGDPGRAAAVPGMENLLSSALSLPGKIPPENIEGLLINAAILKVLKNDIPGATAHINALLSPGNGSGIGPGPVFSGRDLGGRGALFRFAGEFFYDHGSPQRAAELFALSSGESALARTADALWLAGAESGARNIWTILVSPGEDLLPGSPQGIRNRSLYNLAATAEDPAGELARLEELFLAGQGGEDPWYNDPVHAEAAYVYGVIRYTRLLTTPRALAILETGKLGSHPLLDLELLRRRQETMPLERNVAETWLLLGRHSGDEGLHRWAAWYFDYQRQYNELALLIKSAERQALRGELFTGPWLELHRSLALMRESRLDEAAERLRALSAQPAVSGWEAPANLARIMESRRAPGAALEYYEIASSLVQDREAASAIQYRISRCLRALGRERESRRVLEYALDLNPNNLNARLELHRMDTRQIF